MAREFGTYSPAVPLGVTWEESIILEDQDGNPIDLAGYAVRAQFYEERPERDPDTGVATVPPIAEITSAGFYSVAPDWPVMAVASITDPSTAGEIVWAVPVADLWTFSENNERRRLYWALILQKADGYAIPVASGTATFLQTNTI